MRTGTKKPDCQRKDPAGRLKKIIYRARVYAGLWKIWIMI